MRILRSIIAVTIPIPIILIPILWALWAAGSYWDKTSAIKQAVKAQVAELVAASELAALREEVKGEKMRSAILQQITERQTEMRINAEVALRNYEQDAANEKTDLLDRIRELEQSDSTGIGVVKPELYDRLPDR